MLTKKIAYLINFDKELSKEIIENIKSAYKEIDELRIIDKKVTIKMQKQLYIQCVDIRQQLETDNPGIFDGDKPVIINLPGLSIAAVYLVNEIEAKLKTKPFILELIKDKDSSGLFGQFNFRRILDLEYNKNVTRTKINTEESYNREIKNEKE